MRTIKEIAFSDVTGMKFFLPIKERITFIDDDSASGKTFFFNSLRMCISSLDVDSVFQENQDLKRLNDGRIEVFNYDSRPNTIQTILDRKYNDYVICLDNADYLYQKYPALSDVIKVDRANQYVLAARGNFGGLPVSVNNTLQAVFYRNERLLKFEPVR